MKSVQQPKSGGHVGGWRASQEMTGKDLMNGSLHRARFSALNAGVQKNGSQQRPRKSIVKAAEPLDYVSFVQHFRQASPYIMGHREKIFVVVIPGEVIAEDHLLASVLEDLALLRGMGVCLVVVIGCTCFIDKALKSMGNEPEHVNGYRVTSDNALQAAIDAAGRARVKVEGFFSKSPPLPLFRRHEKSENKVRHFSGVGVVGGNYVVAKRRGIVDGVDFGHTGEVRSVLNEDVRNQLELGNLVLMTNLGYSSHGNVLNCNVYDVGLYTAIEMEADKIFCLHLNDVTALGLPHWLPLSDAYALIGGAPPNSSWGKRDNGAHHSSQNGGEKVEVDLGTLASYDVPRSVLISVIACDQGVKRAHLVNAEVDGGILLESYTRNGVCTMISTDFYQGFRSALPTDLKGIQDLLDPLAEKGVIVERDPEKLAQEISSFKVFAQDQKVLGCAQAKDIGVNEVGDAVMEVAAFCIHPSMRGHGKGDSMLDYIEQDARSQGVGLLVLLTTQTADWFTHRGFIFAGPAASSTLLPSSRRATIAANRKSELYIKNFDNTSKIMDDPKRQVMA